MEADAAVKFPLRASWTASNPAGPARVQRIAPYQDEPHHARRNAPRHAAPAARDVYWYFDNTDKVEAPANARRLIEKLGVVWPIDAPAAIPIARPRASANASRPNVRDAAD